MRILVSGICGFAGSTIARGLAAAGTGHQVSGFDNFIRPGSERNRSELSALGIKVVHGDVRNASDLETLSAADWVIDAAANPSVLAGVDGKTSSRQLVEHNLAGTVNLLEYCKRNGAGFILLSTSRVYSIDPLASLALKVVNRGYQPADESLPHGVSADGVSEGFATSAPISLYGATKLASEALALEYGHSFELPVFVNRCGVLAGAGQFGRPDQGIFSYWVNSHLRKKPLRFVGFAGTGYQVRDCLHPSDLVGVIGKQLSAPKLAIGDRVANFGGGVPSSMSLCQLNDWCNERFGAHLVEADLTARAFDIPWMVLDCTKAKKLWGWAPKVGTTAVLEEIAAHAGQHPEWLGLSAPQ